MLAESRGMRVLSPRIEPPVTMDDGSIVCGGGGGRRKGERLRAKHPCSGAAGGDNRIHVFTSCPSHQNGDAEAAVNQ